MRKDDFLNRIKEKKDKFKNCFNAFSSFLRDWSGIEHDYASKLSGLSDKAGILTRLEKLSQDSMKDCINIIKTYTSSCSLMHSRFSKTLEVFSTQEISKLRFNFKQNYKEAVESSKIAEQLYRKELTEYASILVDNSEIEFFNEKIDFNKLNIREFQNKHKLGLNDIKSKLTHEIEHIESLVRNKTFEILEQFDKSPQIIDEKLIQNIFEDRSTGEKILNNWVAPRFKLIFDKIEKNLSSNLCVSEQFTVQIENHIQDLLTELNSKCGNSTDFWVPQICQFLLSVTEKILNKIFVNLEKIQLPSLQEFLSQDEEHCLNLFAKYFSATDKPDKVWVSGILTRLELLRNFARSVKKIFSQLTDCEYFMNKCQAKIKQAKNEMTENLAYKIIKGEFFHVFLKLYEPNPLTFFMNSVKEYFQTLAKMTSEPVYSKVLKSAFYWFIEYWKISILKVEPVGSADERIEELKRDTRVLSIFFEDKQQDFRVLGVSREVQKECLQSHFDCISLCINSNHELVQHFLADHLEFDRATIALVLICRNDQESIRTLIERKGLLFD